MQESPQAATARDRLRTLRTITIPDLLFASAKDKARESHRKISEYICYSLEQQIRRDEEEKKKLDPPIARVL